MRSFIPESSPPPRLLVVGLNHRTAPLEVRERLAFDEMQASRALARFREAYPGAEAVLLSTCNRVELYVAGGDLPGDGVGPIARFLADAHDGQAGGTAVEGAAAELEKHLYRREDGAMAEHLFAVASSLDSMVVGETQILAQVKQAYALAAGAGTVGRDVTGGGGVFHALFQRAFAAAKDVHEKTRLAAGRLSVASVAVNLANSVFDRFSDKTVVCVGAGKMASLMLRRLAELRPRRLIVTNRTWARAGELAAEFLEMLPVEARPFAALDSALVEADILLTSTGAASPVIGVERFRGLQKARRYRPAVMVDIAVPRDIEAGVGGLRNVYLYNIDDLQDVAAGNRKLREREIAAARALLQPHVEDFLRWMRARDVGPLVQALYEHCHAIARLELEAVMARNPELTPGQQAELQRLTHRLVGKILHAPVSRLTAPAAGAEAEAAEVTPAAVSLELGAALQELFNLHIAGGGSVPRDSGNGDRRA